MEANLLRVLQDAHQPECMCSACIEADDAFDASDFDYEPDAYDLECGEADTFNDSVRS
jgi:hypothetical protein